jgi:hippurate hydrolase
MCGHDGHVACIMGFLSLYMKIITKIPKNKTIRLLFQPSEEGPISGAKLMVEEGCMNNVD